MTAVISVLANGIDSVRIDLHGCHESAVPLAVCQRDAASRETAWARKNSRTKASAWSHVQIDEVDGEEPCRIELWLRNFAAVPSGSATGGHLWSSGVQLARFLFAVRARLTGKRVIELGCGLGLPSLVAAQFAAHVAATDSEKSLAENLTFNIDANAASLAQRPSVRVLDYTSAQGVRAAGLTSWDVVLFADAILNAQCGIALPHVARALLDEEGKAGEEQPICFGAFSDVNRPGVARFWQEVSEAGLRVTEVLKTSWSRVYAFEPVDCPSKALEDVLRSCGADGYSDSDAGEVVPLFDGIE